MKLDYVDLYLIHFPRHPDLVKLWAEMEDCQSKGLAKSIGVSNFAVPDLKQIESTWKVTPAANQIRLHPYNYAEQKATIDYCQSKGIVIEAFSPLTPITKSPGGPVDEVVKKIAEKRKAKFAHH